MGADTRRARGVFWLDHLLHQAGGSEVDRLDAAAYPMVLAAATLAVAAVLGPARLRDQVDLDELLGVVDQTMQPTRAWLWLRSPAWWGWQASNLRPSDSESLPTRPAEWRVVEYRI